MDVAPTCLLLFYEQWQEVPEDEDLPQKSGKRRRMMMMRGWWGMMIRSWPPPQQKIVVKVKANQNQTSPTTHLHLSIENNTPDPSSSDDVLPRIWGSLTVALALMTQGRSTYFTYRFWTRSRHLHMYSITNHIRMCIYFAVTKKERPTMQTECDAWKNCCWFACCVGPVIVWSWALLEISHVHSFFISTRPNDKIFDLSQPAHSVVGSRDGAEVHYHLCILKSYGSGTIVVVGDDECVVVERLGWIDIWRSQMISSGALLSTLSTVDATVQVGEDSWRSSYQRLCTMMIYYQRLCTMTF